MKEYKALEYEQKILFTDGNKICVQVGMRRKMNRDELKQEGRSDYLGPCTIYVENSKKPLSMKRKMKAPWAQLPVLTSHKQQ